MVLILSSMTVDIAECFNTEYQADHMTSIYRLQKYSEDTKRKRDSKLTIE